MSTSTADWTDDVVWSNAAYLLPAFTALWDAEWTAVALMGVAGAYLAYASGLYHAVYTRRSQRLDVHAMMTYLIALAAVVASQWTPWAYAVVPLASAAYGRWTWDIDSYVHVPLWGALTLTGVAVQAGWWTLVPAGLFALGGSIKLYDPGADTELHSLWHLAGGAAAAVVVGLL